MLKFSQIQRENENKFWQSESENDSMIKMKMILRMKAKIIVRMKVTVKV